MTWSGEAGCVGDVVGGAPTRVSTFHFSSQMTDVQEAKSDVPYLSGLRLEQLRLEQVTVPTYLFFGPSCERVRAADVASLVPRAEAPLPSQVNHQDALTRTTSTLGNVNFSTGSLKILPGSRSSSDSIP